MTFSAALFSALISVSAFARTEIAFDREIEVSDRPRLTWADLVTVKGGSNALFAELAGVDYGNGGAMEIRDRLRERKIMSDVYEGVKITVPQDITVRKVQGYSSAEFRRKLMPLLELGCPECKIELRGVRDENIRLGSEWRIGDFSANLQSSLLIPVTSKGLNAWVPVQLKVSRKALVMKRSVPMGQKLTVDDIMEKEMDVGQLREFPARASDLMNAVTGRTLSTNQILTLSDLKREELVKRGQGVKLIAGSEDFEITVNAIAEEGGGLGDVIKVKNVESNRTMSAVVNGQGQVKLQ